MRLRKLRGRSKKKYQTTVSSGAAVMDESKFRVETVSLFGRTFGVEELEEIRAFLDKVLPR